MPAVVPYSSGRCRRCGLPIVVAELRAWVSSLRGGAGGNNRGTAGGFLGAISMCPVHGLGNGDLRQE